MSPFRRLRRLLQIRGRPILPYPTQAKPSRAGPSRRPGCKETHARTWPLYVRMACLLMAADMLRRWRGREGFFCGGGAVREGQHGGGGLTAGMAHTHASLGTVLLFFCLARRPQRPPRPPGGLMGSKQCGPLQPQNQRASAWLVMRLGHTSPLCVPPHACRLACIAISQRGLRATPPAALLSCVWAWGLYGLHGGMHAGLPPPP
eukprot:363031-Chlamydomonas_euryale.AAC.6